jgi:hypothetical protein
MEIAQFPARRHKSGRTRTAPPAHSLATGDLSRRVRAYSILFKFISADWFFALQFSDKEKKIINNENALIKSSGGSVLPP